MKKGVIPLPRHHTPQTPPLIRSDIVSLSNVEKAYLAKLFTNEQAELKFLGVSVSFSLFLSGVFHIERDLLFPAFRSNNEIFLSSSFPTVGSFYYFQHNRTCCVERPKLKGT